MTPSRDIVDLLQIMARLRTPVTGCAWDLKQTFASIVPHTIEEAYEVADAVARNDRADLKDELGDLLLQVVFQARIAEEEGSFDFGGVVEAITAKLVRRHPHIFGDARHLSAEEVERQWAAVKSLEKDRASLSSQRQGHLGTVPLGLPALLRALKLQRRAAEVGFDWNDVRLVLEKIREEADEAEASLADETALAEEVGDLLFAVVNLARHAGVDPDVALASTNRKFERRFAHLERALADAGRNLENADLAEMEALWQDAKHAERDVASASTTATVG